MLVPITTQDTDSKVNTTTPNLSKKDHAQGVTGVVQGKKCDTHLETVR